MLQCMNIATEGITLPVVLPDLSNIIKDVNPSVQYSWFDDKGLHSYYKGTGIEPSLGGAVAGGAIGAAVALPAFARTRDQAQRVVSMNNLKQLALASIMYANDNNGQFSQNLEQLDKYIGNKKVLESPLKPANFIGPSYIYVPGH